MTKPPNRCDTCARFLSLRDTALAAIQFYTIGHRAGTIGAPEALAAITTIIESIRNPARKRSPTRR